MSKFDNVAAKYSRKEVALNAALFGLIEEVLKSPCPLEEAKKRASEKFPLPKLRITEAWGRPESGDREIIEKYSRNIQGNTLSEKLQFLANIIEGNAQLTDIRTILSTLVMIEVLSTILSDYTESAGGFIFEGFLAGLFGVGSEQITDVDKETTAGATGKPITDVVLGDKHYSLKLLGQATEVKGSFVNMVEHFKVENHVVYLDARRIGHDQGLEFGEFLITLDNFLEIFVTPFLKQVYKKKPETFKKAEDFQNLLRQLVESSMAIKKIVFSKPGIVPSMPTMKTFDFSPEAGMPVDLEEVKVSGEGMQTMLEVIINMDPALLQEYGPFTIVYAESKFENTKAEKLFGSYAIVQQLQKAIESKNKDKIIKSLMKTPGYLNREQFLFTRGQAESIANFEVIGTLPLGRETLASTWTKYAELLNSTIAPVYQSMGLFDENITNYFTGVGEGPRKVHATEASRNIDQLKTATDNAISTIESSQK